MEHFHNKIPFSPRRRQFISDSVKIALLSTIVSPFSIACNNKTKDKKFGDTDSTNTGKKTTTGSKKNRKKWSHEGLVVNSKTNVMHLPSSKVYHYYDEIKPSHLKAVSLAGLTSILEGGAKINKQQSGIILEIMALQQLKNEGFSDASLDKATGILSKTFSEEINSRNGRNVNETNFRLHELMLQFIVLNNSIPNESKWQAFNSKIKKPAMLRKRQAWMSGETQFAERVNYILERRNDYQARLTARAGRYSFT
jgi:hypothetical protein